jgi:hypothetical protein
MPYIQSADCNLQCLIQQLERKYYFLKKAQVYKAVRYAYNKLRPSICMLTSADLEAIKMIAVMELTY